MIDAKKNGYPSHPYAELFPIDDGVSLLELRSDIADNGLIDEIVLYDGRVLDGRRREIACFMEGVEPRYTEFQGDDAAALRFVISKNLKRRHLSDAERAMIAAKIAKLPLGANQHREGSPIGEPSIMTRAQAAKTMNVSKRNIDRAKVVTELGSVELQDAVKSGVVSLSDAEQVANKPTEVQNKALRHVEAGMVPTAAVSVELQGILCSRCKRGAVTKDCAACEKLRKKALHKKARKAYKAKASAHVDAFKNPIPNSCKDAWSDPFLQQAYDILCLASERIRDKRIADGMLKRKKHYPFINANSFVDKHGELLALFGELIDHIKEFRPAGVCPNCEGQKCSRCRMSGLVPRELYLEMKKKELEGKEKKPLDGDLGE